jgi:hypothetical protein
MAASRANALLDAELAAAPWIKPHVGSPGANGTSNAAVETTRKQATWNAASNGVATNSNTLTWTGVAGSETWTHYSRWTASSGGTFYGSGTLTGNALTAGDNATIDAGAITASVPNVAS